MLPGVPQCCDSIGYNPKATGQTYRKLGRTPQQRVQGKVALLNVPQIGVMDAAMAIEALGLKKVRRQGAT